MKKYLFIISLWFAFLVPNLVQAANRFLTCTTTCTITAIDVTIWGTVSGGTGASVPGSGDAVILDAGTCVGGTTCTATMGAGYNPTWQTFDMSACTASTAGCIFDANPNTNTITLTSSGTVFNNSGAGTRTLSGGTWVLSGNTPTWNANSSGTVTNAPSVNFSGTTGSGLKTFACGGKTYGTVTLASSTVPTQMNCSGTIGTWTVNPGNSIMLFGGVAQTVTTFSNIVGSPSVQTVFYNVSPNSGTATISSANNWSCIWCGFSVITISGGGTFTGSSYLNFGNNTGFGGFTPPSVGGSTPKTIGG